MRKGFFPFLRLYFLSYRLKCLNLSYLDFRDAKKVKGLLLYTTIEAHKANLACLGRVQLTAGNINPETVIRSSAVSHVFAGYDSCLWQTFPEYFNLTYFPLSSSMTILNFRLHSRRLQFPDPLKNGAEMIFREFSFRT